MRHLSGVAILLALALIGIVWGFARRRPRARREGTLRGDLDNSERNDV